MGIEDIAEFARRLSKAERKLVYSLANKTTNNSDINMKLDLAYYSTLCTATYPMTREHTMIKEVSRGTMH